MRVISVSYFSIFFSISSISLFTSSSLYPLLSTSLYLVFSLSLSICLSLSFIFSSSPSLCSPLVLSFPSLIYYLYLPPLSPSLSTLPFPAPFLPPLTQLYSPTEVDHVLASYSDFHCVAEASIRFYLFISLSFYVLFAPELLSLL